MSEQFIPATTSPASTVDPDVDLPVRGHRSELREAPWGVLGVISAGGGLGALARYGLSAAFPRPDGGFGWATFGISSAWVPVSRRPSPVKERGLNLIH